MAYTDEFKCVENPVSVPYSHITLSEFGDCYPLQFRDDATIYSWELYLRRRKPPGVAVIIN